MNIIRYPERLEWNFLLKRSALQTESLRETVCEILEKIRTQGDRAVIGYEEQFDKVKLNSLEVTEKEFEEAEKEVDIKLKAAIMLALNNIQTFHFSQKFASKKIETLPGVTYHALHFLSGPFAVALLLLYLLSYFQFSLQCQQ